MPDITISIDEKLLKFGREYAEKHHTSVNALIVVSAESAHGVTLWTEDLNQGQVVRGVRIENPLIGKGGLEEI